MFLIYRLEYVFIYSISLTQRETKLQIKLLDLIKRSKARAKNMSSKCALNFNQR